jgi:DNA polymerase eta
VQQWQGLIAINYPARAFGLNRHVTVAEAKEKCPELICQHVATWKEGDVTWSYGDGDEAFREIASRKVSLDPYRLQSRKILAVIKEFLPADVQKVEKASIDEVFLDLSAQVHGIMLERYPELKGPPPYDDPSEPLARPSTTALDWAADALVDLDKEQSEEDDPDWDDIAILIASEIVRDVRQEIFDKLHFTCSAGISKNKMIAKLGSAHKKPNSQTVVRNRAVQHFLSDFKFTKIRNLGGKLGDEIVAAFNTDTVAALLPIPVEQFKKTLSDDTGSWLYNIIRGEDNSEVNPRTQIKSMLSAKSFRPSINALDVACKWLRIFVADIYSRLVEEGVLENKRRPKTMNLHHRQGAQTRSKSVPIPLGRAITEDGMFELAKSLLAQVVVDGRAWPCANLSLSVGGFEEGVQGNKGIGSFLVRGEDAKALQNAQPKSEATPPPAKRRRVDDSGIAKFFGSAREDSRDSSGGDVGLGEFEQRQETPQQASHQEDAWIEEESQERAESPASNDLDPLLPPPSAQTAGTKPPPEAESWSVTPLETNESLEVYTCPRCGTRLLPDEKAEHDDFHFAQDLQNEQTTPPRAPPKPSPPTAKPSAAGPSRGGGGSARGRGRGRPSAMSSGPERGQKRLHF